MPGGIDGLDFGKSFLARFLESSVVESKPFWVWRLHFFRYLFVWENPKTCESFLLEGKVETEDLFEFWVVFIYVSVGNSFKDTGSRHHEVAFLVIS